MELGVSRYQYSSVLKGQNMFDQIEWYFNSSVPPGLEGVGGSFTPNSIGGYSHYLPPGGREYAKGDQEKIIDQIYTPA
jgi:hypothetical protein